MIKTILIANRGEIACRIAHTCRLLGIRSVAVYTGIDGDAAHVRAADMAYLLEGDAPLAPYLNSDQLIRAAEACAADAIHPGYGFLSEDADFARACEAAGIIFIGPPADVIEQMGNKRAAKNVAAAANVATARWLAEPFSAAQATEVGFPLMIKAAAGGGGKGMQIVQAAGELQDAIAAARRQAKQAFGNDELLLEQLIGNARHVEVQIAGDKHGNLVHLGERDCSLQRRYQKIVEETPAPGLSNDLRNSLYEGALAIGRQLNYSSVGTVEFLVDDSENYYFLEVNTRIQVEHPVTEMVYGIDLIAWQIWIAQDQRLPLTQQQITGSGHAVEARIYAEDPANEFLPTGGTVSLWRPPLESGHLQTHSRIRVDAGIAAGDRISPHFDPLLAKIVVWGRDRRTAVRRLHRALQQTTLFGVVSNLRLLQQIADDPAFAGGDYNSGLIEQVVANCQPADVTAPALIAASLAQIAMQPDGYWRNNPNAPLLYRYKDQPDVLLAPQRFATRRYHASIGDAQYTVVLHSFETPQLVLSIDRLRQTVVLQQVGRQWWVQLSDGQTVILQSQSLTPAAEANVAPSGSLRAPMPGTIIAVLVKVGEQVAAGQPLLKVEAMKMEHTIRSGAAGVVEAIYFAAGDQVDAEATLLNITPAD